MKPLSAGKGYQYLLRSVVIADGERTIDSPLTRYYTQAVTPSGRWLGSGLSAFGEGQLEAGAEVSEPQIKLLLGAGRDPVTGDQLGLAFREYLTIEERIAKRVAGISPYLSTEERAERIAVITAEEKESGPRTAVAGFDFTFSVPKSVSALWAVADAATQEVIVAAHHEAIDEVMNLLEHEVAVTRKGVAGANGAVAQADIVGIAATSFDHWDSRTHDPQLHTHVVVSNKAKTTEDGRWRSLDGTPIHAAVVALSEFYNCALADKLTQQFGLGWEARERGDDRNPAWEIAGVPGELISEFSSRSRAIDLEKDRLIAEYVAVHRWQPSRRTVIKLRSQATLATRPEKEIRSLSRLTNDWRARASALLGSNSTQWATALIQRQEMRGLRSKDVSTDVFVQVGQAVVTAISERRSTWRHWNLWAEACRQTMGWRFVSVQDREAAVAAIVDAATRASVSLAPPELAVTPEHFQRKDGSSRFRPAHSTVYSSVDTLGAEARLLQRAELETAPVVSQELVDKVVRTAIRGQLLSDEQAKALVAIATSGRQVDLFVGPAGAGKTTAMRALSRAWSMEHGPTSVVGLAPSAAAAAVLADDLELPCENTAKWLYDHDRGAPSFAPGQLVIVDEATLAGTQALDRLTAVAGDVGAKVLLVGDWAQIQSVEAGGAFAMLTRARVDAPELSNLHRFTHAWEKRASLNLRHGRTEVIATYLAHQRIKDGTTEEMLHQAYAAWRCDDLGGRSSVLVTESSQAVAALNERARAERIATGETEASREVELVDGNRASVGDLIITRRNDRQLRTRFGGFVRNGDRWIVVDVRGDKSVVVRRYHHHSGESVTLPATYASANVDLGYAVTAHRAQGVTVDTAHVVVTKSTTRENLYVSMTRGRDSNIAYVALDQPDCDHASPPDVQTTARSVLYGVLHHSGAELSAHDTIEVEQERWSSIAQLAAEYETLATEAQRERWTTLLLNCGLTAEQTQETVAADSFGPLIVELRRAEAHGHQVAEVVPAIVAQRSLADAEDIGAVLLDRLRSAIARPQAACDLPSKQMIAGLIAKVTGEVPADFSQALREREDLIQSRARTLVDLGVGAKAPWLRRLGVAPTRAREREEWLRAASTVAAYRDRHHVEAQTALGPRPESIAQRIDYSLAAAAVRRAEGLAREAMVAQAIGHGADSERHPGIGT